MGGTLEISIKKATVTKNSQDGFDVTGNIKYLNDAQLKEMGLSRDKDTGRVLCPCNQCSDLGSALLPTGACFSGFSVTVPFNQNPYMD